jgi:hypothetical protein
MKIMFFLYQNLNIVKLLLLEMMHLKVIAIELLIVVVKKVIIKYFMVI